MSAPPRTLEIISTVTSRGVDRVTLSLRIGLAVLALMELRAIPGPR